MRRLSLIGIVISLLMAWASAVHAQCTGCPYAYSPLGTASFNSATYEQHGVGSGNAGSDIWTMSWASDNNIYAHWGDGQGWNQVMGYVSFGWTRITNNPPSLTATDVGGNSGIEWKPQGFVADSGNTQRGFYAIGDDNFTSSYVMTSSDQGTNWTRSGTQIFSVASDGVHVHGMAQAGSGYTGTLPADVSDSYYYIYLGGIGAQTAGHPTPVNSEVYLARVPKASIATKASYEYVTAIGAGPTYTPTWGAFANKIPVFVDTNGWDYLIQVTYWPALDRWILSNAHNIDKLGLFEGDTPWGPWRTLYYGNFRDSLRKFTYMVPQKWMSSSAPYTFWMAFSGWPEYDNVSFIQGTITSSDTVAPKPPVFLQLVINSTTQLTVTWTAPTLNADDTTLTDLAGYRIYYCTGASCTPSTTITPDLGLVTSYAHLSLTPGTIYRYQIVAKDTAGNLSALSEVVEAATASNETLTMSATSTPNNWTNTGGATKMASVLTNDSATTYIASGTTSGTQQQFAITDPASIVSADTIINVRLRVWARKIVTNAVGVVTTAVLGGNTLTSTCTMTTQNIWQECLFDMATKPGTGAWTLTDVQNLEVRVQNNAARVIQATLIEAVVSYVPDPAPKPPSDPLAGGTDPTTILVSWTAPTLNTDNSAFTDNSGYRLTRCAGTSCVPATDGADITPDLNNATTSYSDTGRTTGTSYSYSVRAKDSTGKLSRHSIIVQALASANPPALIQHDWRFHTPGLSTVVYLANDDVPYKVRQDGGVRLRLQMTNDGPNASRTYPLQCNVDGGTFTTLTVNCATFGVCLRDNGGITHGATITQTLPLPAGVTSYAGGAYITNATWPSLSVNTDYAGEFEYDLGISGLTAGQQVCCRLATMDSYSDPPGNPCFQVFSGSASR